LPGLVPPQPTALQVVPEPYAWVDEPICAPGMTG
jgi:hypothetical protein